MLNHALTVVVHLKASVISPASHGKDAHTKRISNTEISKESGLVSLDMRLL